MPQRLNYSEIDRIEFTEADTGDVIAANETSSLRGGKVLAALNLSNFLFEAADPAVLTKFAELARVMKLQVSVVHAGLEIKRDLTADEVRGAALEALRYGYGNTARRIRDERAAEQGIEVYYPEEPAAS